MAGILDALNADKGEDLGDDAWKELLTGPNIKALTIGTGLVFFQQVGAKGKKENKLATSVFIRVHALEP